MNTALGALSAVFWGVVLLSILVFVHEGGHFLAARAFGVRVTEFYLGLPCRFKLFVKSKKRGTEFGVTPFLLGGYNRICGMEGVEDELLAPAFAIVQREGRVEAERVAQELDVDVSRAYDMLVVLTDWAAIRPYYNPELGEHPHQRDYPAAFETLRRDANMLTEYDAGNDFAQEGSTEAGAPRALEAPREQLAQERSRTYLGCSFPKRIAILVAGPLVNLLLAFVLAVGAYMSVEYQMPVNESKVGSVAEDSIAQQTGLQAGDEIEAVGDTKTTTWEELHAALAAACKAGEDFSLTVRRDGASTQLTVDLPEGEEVEAIGITCQTTPYHLTLPEAMRAAISYAGMVGRVSARLIMPQHTMEVLDQSSSIVGISVMASEAVSKGLLDVLTLVAAISMSLGFMNLLPIPPLDGGKILIEVIELCIRRPLSQRARLIASYVGLAFFAFVFVVVLRNDFARILFH
ncbi:MAG: M50 family metallopeptidase [Coriobacteriales bacterium]|nr:M50 family metallopeptidase [Coriobacteriales bacterium]